MLFPSDAIQYILYNLRVHIQLPWPLQVSILHQGWPPFKKKKNTQAKHTHVAAHNNTQEKNRLIVIKIQTAANKEVIVGAPTSEHIAAVMQLTFEHQVSSMLNAAKVLEWILCASPLGFPKVTIITNWCKQTCPKFPQDNFPVTAAANYDVWWDNFLMRCPGED